MTHHPRGHRPRTASSNNGLGSQEARRPREEVTPPCLSSLQPAVLTQEGCVPRAGEAWAREGAGIQPVEARDTPQCAALPQRTIAPQESVLSLRLKPHFLSYSLKYQASPQP